MFIFKLSNKNYTFAVKLKLPKYKLIFVIVKNIDNNIFIS